MDSINSDSTSAHGDTGIHLDLLINFKMQKMYTGLHRHCALDSLCTATSPCCLYAKVCMLP
jgi:hypothetical protein